MAHYLNFLSGHLNEANRRNDFSPPATLCLHGKHPACSQIQSTFHLQAVQTASRMRVSASGNVWSDCNCEDGVGGLNGQSCSGTSGQSFNRSVSISSRISSPPRSVPRGISSCHNCGHLVRLDRRTDFMLRERLRLQNKASD